MKYLKLSSIYLGNLFEHYDNALYSFLSPFFATLFFPNTDPITALILTFCITPLGMLARPVGSLFFGYIGDVKGRDLALFFSLLGMGLVTASIGMLPTFNEIGRFAPLLLLITRILQNFFASGEIIGGAICYLENIDNEKEKNLASSIYNTSTVAGILTASAVVAGLYHLDYVESGWRLVYLFGSVTALTGAALRWLAPPSCPKAANENPTSHSFVGRLGPLWQMRGKVFLISLAAGFSYATYAIVFSLMNGFIPLVSAIDKSEITKMNTILLFLDIILLPLFGLLANRFGHTKMMITAAVAAALSGIPLFYVLENCNMAILILVRIAIVTIGVWFSATFHSWTQSFIPKVYRYTVISFSYALGSQLFGGTAPAISLWLYQQTGWVVSASWYWILLALATSLCLLRQQEQTLRIPRQGESYT